MIAKRKKREKLREAKVTTLRRVSATRALICHGGRGRGGEVKGVDSRAGGVGGRSIATKCSQLSTSGRIHGEFLRLLYILAHRRTVRWFAQSGDDHPSDEAFKFRRGQYVWHARAAMLLRVWLPNVCPRPSKPCVPPEPAPTPCPRKFRFS